MSVSADSAEQVVRIALDGVDYSLRIAGKSAEAVARIAAFIAAALKDTSDNSPGKKSLAQMIREGTATQFFELPERDLKEFTKQAKQYGIQFHAIPVPGEGLVDLMVREADAPRINRIIERVHLAGVETGNVEADQPDELQHVLQKTENEKIIDKVVKPKEKTMENPSAAKTVPADPSAQRSKNRPSAEKDKPSVKQKIEEIRKEQKAAKETVKEAAKELGGPLAEKAAPDSPASR